MSHVAIIPARSGSKRVPGKNVRNLGAKPLIAWTIEAALSSNCYDRVIVSTDDQKIAAVAREYGAETPFLRPAQFASDTSSSEDVINHAVCWLEHFDNVAIKTVTLLQPTSPFRFAKNIREAFDLFFKKDADAVVSVMEAPVKLELCNTLPKNLSLKGFIKTEKTRTQDMDVYYQLNGAIYLFKRNFCSALGGIYDSRRSFAYIMASENSIDIDSELDFKWAEFVNKAHFGNS